MRKLVKSLLVSSLITTFLLVSSVSVMAGPGGGIVDSHSKSIIQQKAER